MFKALVTYSTYELRVRFSLRILYLLRYLRSRLFKIIYLSKVK
nr:MAG TPA: hypothetical protein [Caudoviricetes sp.]